MIVLLLLAPGFVGPQTCATCHAAIAATQLPSHHANALRPLAQSPFSKLLRPLKERNGAAFRYEDGHAIAEVAGQTARMPLVWAFGAGSQAYTALGFLDGAWVEHRVSWYRRRDGLGLTPGHNPAPSSAAQSALGVVQSPATAYRCFNCHASNVQDGPKLDDILPGITCERCHGPGLAHVEAARASKPLRNTITNPGRFPARALVGLCAECHRTPDDRFFSETPEIDDPLSVRFAPIGLRASRCFQKSTTLSCISCHSPHRDPLPASDPAYSAVCLKCHAQTRAHTAVKDRCVACHMQPVSPAANLEFTDHRIRVYPE